MALTADPRMQVVPAHIWTPWFSLFGSKSGFDAVEECFGDLSSHITALETGLSSDPAMNRLISALDRYAMISSSDAHSPQNLGREATVIEGPPSWENLVDALQGGSHLLGTVEFFPEEGKYHLDGHSDCGPALTPEDTAKYNGLCPVCGKPVTIGVLSRVLELSDRTQVPEGILKPDWHILPLKEVLCQILDRGPTARDVETRYFELVEKFGSEFNLLLSTPIDDIKDNAGAILARAIEKMRLGDIEIQGGYDGKFGKITVIGKQERITYSGQGMLFASSPKTAPGESRPARGRPKGSTKKNSSSSSSSSNSSSSSSSAANPIVKRRSASEGSILSELTEQQLAAVTYGGQTLAINAGPGSGKTMVLIRRTAWLLRKQIVEPEALLLTTYTKKAAEALTERIKVIVPDLAHKVRVGTLHSVALDIASRGQNGFSLASEQQLLTISALAASRCNLSPKKFQSLLSLHKNLQNPQISDGALMVAFDYHQARLKEQNLWDFDDLIEAATSKADPHEFKAVLVDEFQDFSFAQFKLLCALSVGGLLTVIGDPDQSIYGFRGAMKNPVAQLSGERPDLTSMDLTLNFRSTQFICQLSQAARPSQGLQRKPFHTGRCDKIGRAVFKDPQSESNWVVSRIVSHLGVTNLGAQGSARADREAIDDLGLSDIAVIFRLRQQGQYFAKSLNSVGLAWQMAGEQEHTATDNLDFKADKINLLTMHASKGLEFKLVFVVGLEEGLCPYELGDDDNLDEEKRLFYVAVSRAKHRLYLTRATSRIIYGKHLSGAPSSFWLNLPKEILSEHQHKSSNIKLTPKPSRLF
jgi:DNA helicase-2/ATP-dependent DNA helicase PcrA